MPGIQGKLHVTMMHTCLHVHVCVHTRMREAALYSEQEHQPIKLTVASPMSREGRTGALMCRPQLHNSFIYRIYYQSNMGRKHREMPQYL